MRAFCLKRGEPTERKKNIGTIGSFALPLPLRCVIFPLLHPLCTFSFPFLPLPHYPLNKKILAQMGAMVKGIQLDRGLLPGPADPPPPPVFSFSSLAICAPPFSLPNPWPFLTCCWEMFAYCLFAPPSARDEEEDEDEGEEDDGGKGTREPNGGGGRRKRRTEERKQKG